MLGWWIIISTQSPGERDKSDLASRRAAILAQWEAGVGGTSWIELLCEQGKASKLSSSGYPNRYTVRALDALPLLQSPSETGSGTHILGENFAIPSRWRSKIEWHAERCAQCPPDQLLTIDAWDQS